MRSQALEDLFLDELGEIYDAEKRMYKGLGQLSKAAVNAGLKSALDRHKKQTREHIRRLEEAFRLLNEEPKDGKAPGISVLLKQGLALAHKDTFDPAVVDAGLIASAQKLEHYEIAAYGCVRTHAGILGYQEIETLLDQNLREEEHAAALLTQVAETVNAAAAAAPYAQARTGTRHGLGQIMIGDHDQESEKPVSLGKLALGLALGGVLSLLLSPRIYPPERH